MIPPFVMKAIWAVVIVIALIAGFKLWLSYHDKALLSGYVLQSEKTALQSQLDEVERQRNAAAQSLEEYRKRKLADDLIQQQLEAKQEQAIKDDNQNADDGEYRWDGVRDLEWLCRNGSKAPDCRR